MIYNEDIVSISHSLSYAFLKVGRLPFLKVWQLEPTYSMTLFMRAPIYASM